MAVTSTLEGSITVTDDVTSEAITFPLTQKLLDAAPILSAPTVVETTPDSATVSVTTDLPSEGLLIARVYDAAATPSDADVLAGTGALHTQSGTPDASGTTSFGFNLTPDQFRKAHFVHQCSAIVSNVDATAQFVATSDATAPVLSSASATPTGETTVDLSITTDTGEGTLYRGIWPDGSTPDAAAVKAGTGATVQGSQAVAATGAQATAISGLTAGTAYEAAWAHEDAVGNLSTVATVGFTTDAAAAPNLASAATTAFDPSIWDASTGYTWNNDGTATLDLSTSGNPGTAHDLPSPYAIAFPSSTSFYKVSFDVTPAAGASGSISVRIEGRASNGFSTTVLYDYASYKAAGTAGRLEFTTTATADKAQMKVLLKTGSGGSGTVTLSDFRVEEVV